ncbi:hypothetical protein [Marinomonas sp.]|uniref:hypothetical protein n=1 Tax=Marinomonas sp. TaxID=1904862 RepID=UPI003BAB859C
MKKLIVLSAIATLSSGAALASNLDVGGSVPSVCEVTTSGSSAHFAKLEMGEKYQLPITSLRCNDYDGATVTLTSSEGHMQTVDGKDATGVGYTAQFKAGPYDFTLNATTGADDIHASQSKNGSAALAAGYNSGNIFMTVTQTPTFAGNYTDQLMLTITAN